VVGGRIWPDRHRCGCWRPCQRGAEAHSITRLVGRAARWNGERSNWVAAPLCWWPSPETSTEHPAKSEGMICPIALQRGRGCYLLNAPAQPKHDSRPGALGCCFLTELIFQAPLESLGTGFLVFGCGGIRKYGGESPQFPVNSRSGPGILAYWHLPHPVIESTTIGGPQLNTKPRPLQRATLVAIGRESNTSRDIVDQTRLSLNGLTLPRQVSTRNVA
jgi:hypothetical protein